VKNRLILCLFALGAWLSPGEVDLVEGVSHAAILAVIAVTAILATLASTGVSVYMQQEAAQAQEKAAKRQAIAKREQVYAEDERLRRLRKIHMRRLREGIGKSGIRGDIGTGLDVQLDTSSELEMDALNRRQTSLYNIEEERAAGLNRANAMELQAIATGLQGVGQATQIGLGYQALGRQPSGGDQSGGTQ